MQGLESNDYQDHEVIRGTSFRWMFDIGPLDLTGCTAVMSVATLGDLPVTLSTYDVGPTRYSRFQLNDVAPSVTSAWTTGTYDYTVFVTFADNVTRLAYGTGKVLVR